MIFKNRKLGRLISFVFVILMSTPLAAEENNIEVLIEGYGTSVEAATKNAIEQALMQAVGRLIDATTIITKKTEIENEMRSVSKSIDKSTLEYSQGVINSYKQISLKDDGGIFRVTALVSVRSKELTPILDGVVAGNEDISSSLFSTLQVENEQQADRVTLLITKILTPLVLGSATELSSQPPKLIRGKIHDAITNEINELAKLKPGLNGHNSLSHDVQRFFRPQWFDGKFNLSLQYTNKMKPEFKKQMVDLLEATADASEMDIKRCLAYDDALNIIFVEEFNIRCYRFDAIKTDFWNNPDLKSLGKNAKFSVQLFDSNQSLLTEAVQTEGSITARNCATGIGSYPSCESLPFIFFDMPVKYTQQIWPNSWVPMRWSKGEKLFIFENFSSVLILAMDQNLAKRAANINFGITAK